MFSLGWKTIVTILYGTLLLRIAGRKSLSQMTIAQTVVMLAIGTVLIEPLVGTELINTYAIVAIAVFTLIVIEYAEIRYPSLKKIFTGEPVLLIENGEINRKNLKRVRMTIQQLEMELRQASIPHASEVKWATLEPNGQFGFVLKDEFQSVSKREYLTLLHRLETIEALITPTDKCLAQHAAQQHFSDEKQTTTDTDIFEKVAQEQRHQ